MDTRTLLRRYWKAVQKRWWVPAALALTAVGGATYQFGCWPPKGCGQAIYHVRYVGSVYLLPTTSPSPSSGGNTAGQPTPLTQQITNVANDLVQLAGTAPIAERVAQRPGMPPADAVLKYTWASVPKNTDLVLIRASALSRQRAAALANAVAEEIITYYRELNSRDAREARLLIGAQLARLRAQLEASDRELLNAQQNPLSVQQAGNVVLSNYYTALAALDDAQTSLQEKNASLTAAVAERDKQASTLVSETDVGDNPRYLQIQSNLTNLELQRTQMAEIFTPEYQPLQDLDAQIASLQRRLAAEAKTEVQRTATAINPVQIRLSEDAATLRKDQAGATAGVAARAAAVRDRRATFAALAEAQSRLAVASRENQIIANNYSTLSQAYHEALVRENNAQFFPAGIQIVQNAVPPVFPWPWLIWIEIGAFLGGLVVGVILVIGLEALDESVRTRGDVEEALGAPVLGAVPNVRRSKSVGLRPEPAASITPSR